MPARGCRFLIVCGEEAIWVILKIVRPCYFQAILRHLMNIYGYQNGTLILGTTHIANSNLGLRLKVIPVM